MVRLVGGSTVFYIVSKGERKEGGNYLREKIKGVSEEWKKNRSTVDTEEKKERKERKRKEKENNLLEENHEEKKRKNGNITVFLYR